MTGQRCSSPQADVDAISDPEGTGQPVIVEMPLREWRAHLHATAAFLWGVGQAERASSPLSSVRPIPAPLTYSA